MEITTFTETGGVRPSGGLPFRKYIQGGTLGMKTSQQIIGLPVVSIQDGNEIGKVKNVMINAGKGTVDFFVIDSAMRSLAGGVVPVGKVLGIGADALTILEADDVSDIVKIPAAIDLLQKNITVRGTRVLTRKGSLLGTAGDIHVDEEAACGITGVDFIPDSAAFEAGVIPRDAIITFGKNLLVVEEGFTSRLMTAPPAETMPVAEPDAAAPAISFAGTAVEPAAQQNEPAISLDDLFAEPVATEAGNTVLSSGRSQYLRGRRVTRDIAAPDGDSIAKAGDIIDDAMLEKAGAAGCLVELVMNNEA